MCFKHLAKFAYSGLKKKYFSIVLQSKLQWKGSKFESRQKHRQNNRTSRESRQTGIRISK